LAIEENRAETYSGRLRAVPTLSLCQANGTQTDGTDRQTDGHQTDTYTLSIGHSQRENVIHHEAVSTNRRR